MSLDPEMLEELEAARAAEKEQTLFYRALAAAAEQAGDHATAERLNGLHADEEHQLARLTARLLELGVSPAPLEGPSVRAAVLRGWEGDARRLEEAEQRRYQRLLDRPLDATTRRLIETILRVERTHAERLGGKWMGA